MEDPAREIPQVVHLLTDSDSPEVQQAAIGKFFAPDAGFNHPLCKVAPAPGSRDIILGIYQWYRQLSPHLNLEVDSHVYDAAENRAYVNVTQTFHIFFSPFKPAPAHLLVRLTLKEIDGKHYIALQEDFYQPEDIAYLVLPHFAILINAAKYAASIVSNLNAWLFQRFGIWRPQYGPLHKSD